MPENDLLAKSTALLEATGVQLVPLAHPIGPWPLLGVTSRGLTLAAPVTAAPTLLGATYQVPAGWPTGTVRLILHWPEADPLPKAITL